MQQNEEFADYGKKEDGRRISDSKHISKLRNSSKREDDDEERTTASKMR